MKGKLIKSNDKWKVIYDHFEGKGMATMNYTTGQHSPVPLYNIIPLLPSHTTYEKVENHIVINDTLTYVQEGYNVEFEIVENCGINYADVIKIVYTPVTKTTQPKNQINMAKNIFVGIILGALFFSLCYLMGAFFSASFGINNWDTFTRFVVSFLGGIISIMITTIYVIFKSNDQ